MIHSTAGKVPAIVRICFYFLILLLAFGMLAACRPDPASPPPQPTRAIPQTPAPVAKNADLRLQDSPSPVVPGMPSCYCPMPTGVTSPSPPARAAQPPPAATAAPTEGAVAPVGGGKIVAVDPGHGGAETGAVAASGLAEKDVNLRIALKLAALLYAGGFTPVLTRSNDRQVNVAGRDLNGNGVVDVDDDLQARVDIANTARADILVSLHNNGSPSSAVRGTIVYYSLGRPFVDKSIKLAASLQTNIVASLRGAGYEPLDQGISDDSPLKKPYGHLFLLGPLSPRVARVSTMPGALGETLYLSNPVEARLLARDDILAAIARGYYQGIVQYFASSK